jgi:hypothetical protein
MHALAQIAGRLVMTDARKHPLQGAKETMAG